MAMSGARRPLLVVLCGMLLAAGEAAAQGAPSSSASGAPTFDLGAISGNPAATNFTTGTGWLGRTIGIPSEWGITLGGMWLADSNWLVTGGSKPDSWTWNSTLVIDLHVDADKLAGWRGASFGFQFLQLNAADTNGEAGLVAGYNGIVDQPPFARSVLFEAWYLQEIIKDVLQVRIGRSTPTSDFGNVMRPVEFKDQSRNIPAVSGLLWAPIFVNGSMLSAMPGYYNPGDGITVNFTPTKSFYVNVGTYGGNLANHVQTGINPPLFNGLYFSIAEIGTNWLLGPDQKPGSFGIGLWHEFGLITGRAATQDGFGGFYLFGSQQVANHVNPRVPSSSISVFYQVGANNSQTMPITQYYGAGLTGFGLIADRDRDSMGLGVAVSRLNPLNFERSTEVILQAYYQAHLFATTFLQPTISYSPDPGRSPTIPGPLALTMRLTVLF